jgi:DNA-binding transcriptional regulator YiaG
VVTQPGFWAERQEAALVEMKLALAQRLRAQRASRRLSQTAVARLLGSSQSRVAKMEPEMRR